MPEVTVRWNGERRFVGGRRARAQRRHGLPERRLRSACGRWSWSWPGSPAAPGWTSISILEKKRERVTGLTVRVTGSQRDEYPTRWETIHVEYEFIGRGVKTASVERAIELSEEKYCAVRGSLAPEIEFTSSYRVARGRRVARSRISRRSAADRRPQLLRTERGPAHWMTPSSSPSTTRSSSSDPILDTPAPLLVRRDHRRRRRLHRREHRVLWPSATTSCVVTASREPRLRASRS